MEKQRRPSPNALKAAASAGRLGRARAQVRYRFVQRESVGEQDPPMARMLRGGRGGEVRLKLFLTYLWMQTEDQGTPLGYAARAWATLFDLPDPTGAGARRITDAQAWLEKNSFITIAGRPGQSNLVRVLDEGGDGQTYVVPGAAANRERKDEGASYQHRYIQIPKSFWLNGHITVLSGSAVAMFLALLCEKGATAGAGMWFSPSVARDRFALSDDTRGKGLRELANAGLVTTSRRPVNPSDFDERRLRNVHQLNLERLDSLASIAATLPDPFAIPSPAAQ